MRPDKPPRVPVEVADDGKRYHPRYMLPCATYADADHGGPGWCGATPTKHGHHGPACRKHLPPQPKPDPDRTLEGLYRRKKTAEAPEDPPPAPQSASRVHDAQAVASGKRRSTPETYKAARRQLEEGNR